MNWKDALLTGQGEVTAEVARFMTLEFGWEVVTWNGRLSSIMTSDGSHWRWQEVGVSDALAQIREMRARIGLSDEHIRKLNGMFSKLSVGTHTILPFPKDKRSQPPAPAPHFQ
jgi:hypothetical protein